MNVQAHMSGQISGQLPNQAAPQLTGLPQQNGNYLTSQIPNQGALIMDHELLQAREFMKEKISRYLQKNISSAEWHHRVPELAKRLEDRIFKDAASKEDYLNMVREPVEHRLPGIIKHLHSQNQLLSPHISSSSAVGTMIPTPGITHNMSANSVASSDNPMITTSGAGMMPQSTGFAGNLLPNANGSTGLGHNARFHTSDGPSLSGYQQSSANVTLGGNSMMSSMGMPRQSTQMIPTPGLNNLQPVSMDAQCSNGAGLTSIESTMAPQPSQQKQYVGSQNSRLLHNHSSQMGPGTRSNMQQKASPYGFSNGVLNADLGLMGGNMQLVNMPASSEGYLGTASYGSSPKPMQQNVDQQHHQPLITASLSQQMLPMVNDGYALNDELSSSRSLYSPSSSVLSAMNNPNVSTTNMHSKSKANPTILAHQLSLQAMQSSPHMKAQMSDHSQKVNLQPLQPSHDHLVQSQHQLQQFQHQQFQQHSNQRYAKYAQQQQQHQSQQHQQLMFKTDNFRQSPMMSNIGEQLVSEHGIRSRKEVSVLQATEELHFSDIHNHYQQSSSNDVKGSKSLGHISNAQDFHNQFSQGSQQMLHQQVGAETPSASNLSSGSQPETLLRGQWCSQNLPNSQGPHKSSFDTHIQEEFQQRLTGQDEAQRPRFSLEGCSTSHGPIAKAVAVPQSSNRLDHAIGLSTRDRQYLDQRRWLLFLHHARRCLAPKGKCREVNCMKAQQLLVHMELCDGKHCAYPRCGPTRKLLEHYFLTCRAADCPVCIPVREYIALNRKEHTNPTVNDGALNQTDASWRNVDKIDADVKGISAIETLDDMQLPTKRPKAQHVSPFLVAGGEPSPASIDLINQSYPPQEGLVKAHQPADMTMAVDVKVVSSLDCEQENLPTIGSIIGDDSSFVDPVKPKVESVLIDTNDHTKQVNLLSEMEIDPVKTELKQESNAASNDLAAGSKSGKPKIKGVSLTELFTPEQIREHITSLRQWVGQSKAKAEKNQAMEHSMSENSCQLCAVEKLTFEPPPIYCSPCGARIKRNATYYTIGSGETRHYFCIPCYNESRGDNIEVDGSAYLKAKLEKKKNDEETEEWWVQCDKCEAWQHQICALFNGRRNDGGQAEYTCPNCYIEEIERGERKPLPQSAVLGAKDLPRTVLSDHIEQRLFKRLKQERQERAKHQGKGFDEVPGAESLVVRVVSSVDKKLEVKQRFLEIFQEENYPTEFPYKSKVVLLFQKIEGVEVCLFGMYVQEFGSECSFPNQRRVYLSYLDSVKYFRPEIKTVTGEALRTFVYHEILIGYLEYCKKRGFTSCYIWACPPLKGEDYILYCHPEIQKTPKSDKLREWYLAMLRKASKENIVADLTNLYDHFFVTMGECKAKVTAARLPYFDGDYWPGAAEDMINQLRQEEDGRKQQKKGKTKKTITKRALKAAGQAELATNASKDALLMLKLGETICPMKEDFIMVHLQHACSHCCLLMVSGTRWVCNQCKNFQLCEKCHDAEQRIEEKDRHPISGREKHMLYPVEINDVPSDTKDKDEILESEFFDTRQAFLSLCQGNHYQYDTLRRAKHSSMMVLYHLHNPTAPAFVTTCNVCYHDIETGQGWRCEICSDFDVCNGCYQKDGGIDHPHKLTNHPSMADRDAQNKEARQKRVLQLRKMLDLLVHASQCRYPQCQYLNCRKVKGLFRHGIQCKTRALGGCPLCKKMWYLLQLHARACKESECHVPRCRDLKEHLRRSQQQSDSRRRAAVMEMMRQRAAEVAGNTG